MSALLIILLLSIERFSIVSFDTGTYDRVKSCAGWEQKCGVNMPTTLPLAKGERISYVEFSFNRDIYTYINKIHSNGLFYNIEPCNGKKYNSYNLYPRGVRLGALGESPHVGRLRIEIPSNLRLLNIEQNGIGYTWIMQALNEKNVCIYIRAGNMAGYIAEVEPLNISKILALKYE